MVKKSMQYLISAVVVIALMTGCASTPPSTPSAETTFKSFKDYPDHTFNPGEYIQGMSRGGRNILIWQDPSVDLKAYRCANVTKFGGRLLPEQNVFSYDPYIKRFDLSFQSCLKLAREDSEKALRIEGAIVECNPGSRAARYWVGFGAGKAAGAVVCEAYEPGKSQPCMRIYVRETASSGMFGGNSVAMLNHIVEQVAIRLSTVLEARIAQ